MKLIRKSRTEEELDFGELLRKEQDTTSIVEESKPGDQIQAFSYVKAGEKRAVAIQGYGSADYAAYDIFTFSLEEDESFSIDKLHKLVNANQHTDLGDIEYSDTLEKEVSGMSLDEKVKRLIQKKKELQSVWEADLPEEVDKYSLRMEIGKDYSLLSNIIKHEIMNKELCFEPSALFMNVLSKSRHAIRILIDEIKDGEHGPDEELEKKYSDVNTIISACISDVHRFIDREKGFEKACSDLVENNVLFYMKNFILKNLFKVFMDNSNNQLWCVDVSSGRFDTKLLYVDDFRQGWKKYRDLFICDGKSIFRSGQDRLEEILTEVLRVEMLQEIDDIGDFI